MLTHYRIVAVVVAQNVQTSLDPACLPFSIAHIMLENTPFFTVLENK